MKSKYNKPALGFSVLFALILMIELLFASAFPGWTFNKGAYSIANKIVSYSCLFGFIYSAILFFRPGFEIAVGCGVLSVLLLGMFSCSAIHPIDSTTVPVDISFLQTYNDGRKRVARQYKNAKTNAELNDTVVVKDVLIFRRIYKESPAVE